MKKYVEIEAGWERLGITNDFIFGKVMQDPKLCKGLLQRILPNLEIENIKYPELQKSIRLNADAKSVRLDVYVKDSKGTVYDMEMQVVETGELSKRARYYRGVLDLQELDRGKNYKKLNSCYVIFICPFDAFGRGRHIYTFENICREDHEISLDDGTTIIFLNAADRMDDVSPKLKAFLDYVAGKETEDVFVKELEKAVSQVKMNRKWRHEYMTLLMRDQENLERGIREGKKEGMKEAALRMLAAEKYTVEEIAGIAGLAIDEVKRMRTELGKNCKKV